MPKVIKLVIIVLAIFSLAPLFSQEAGPYFSVNTAIAYDSVNNRYLRVSLEDPKYYQTSNYFSGNYIVYGTLIDRDGETVRPKFPITMRQCYCPLSANGPTLCCDVAFDHVNQRYLVVWPDYRSGDGEVYGQLVSADGRLVGAGGNDRSNFRISQKGGNVYQTDLSFDAQAQRFLVVWDVDSDPSLGENGHIYASFVNSKRPSSPLTGENEIMLASSSNSVMRPAAAFDIHNRNYLVVWRERGIKSSDPSGSKYYSVKGQMLDSSGKKIGEHGLVISGPFDNLYIDSPEVAWENRTNRFLVVWHRIGFPSYEGIWASFIYGRIVNPNGTLYGIPGEEGELVVDTFTFFNGPDPDPEKGLTIPPNSSNANVAFDPNRGDFVILFNLEPLPHTSRVAPNGVFTEGLLKLGGDVLFGQPRDKFGLAFNSRCGNFMMSFPIWLDDYYPHFWFLGDSQCPGMAEVKTVSVDEISGSSATCNGKVVMDGGLEVTARGMCWSTEPGPDLSGSYTVDGKGMGYFKSVLTGLEPNTKYYVRAYATNGAGTTFGRERSFTTKKAFQVIFEANDGGSLLGETSQEMLSGGSCSPVKAAAFEGFFFVGWTGDGGFGSSTDNPLAVKNVNGNMNIVAGFSPIHLRGERISARGQALKNDIGEIEISCEAIDASLPLVFKLYRSIGGVGRQVIAQFSAADVADGRHHILDPTLDIQTIYNYSIEVLTNDGAKAGNSQNLIL